MPPENKNCIYSALWLLEDYVYIYKQMSTLNLWFEIYGQKEHT